MKHANVAFFIPHIGCPNKCSFCDQNSISGKQSAPTTDEIRETLTIAIKSMPKDVLKKSEIAFFGGSFTAIDKNLMVSYLECVQQFIGENMFCGIRISTRPDAINKDILDILKTYNVSSIELGAQSMSDEVLLKNMRGHTVNDVISSAKLIKEYGFSLGLQMMTGLYADNEEGALSTAQKIISLKPDTVRIYPTVVLKGTYLEKLFNKGQYTPFNVEQTVFLCAKLLNLFEDNDIKVIRVGLHDQPSLKENFVAGAYHPALGELIMGEQFFLKVINCLKGQNRLKKDVIIFVNPSYVSQLIGQNKRNISRFKSLGYNVTVKGDKSLKEKEIKLI